MSRDVGEFCLIGCWRVAEYQCCEALEQFVVVEAEVTTVVADVDSTWYDPCRVHWVPAYQREMRTRDSIGALSCWIASCWIASNLCAHVTGRNNLNEYDINYNMAQNCLPPVVVRVGA